jgi:hypothetical protein
VVSLLFRTAASSASIIALRGRELLPQTNLVWGGDLQAIWLPEGVRVGSGVSQVQAAFCTTLAAMYGNDDDWASRFDLMTVGFAPVHRN